MEKDLMKTLNYSLNVLWRGIDFRFRNYDNELYPESDNTFLDAQSSFS